MSTWWIHCFYDPRYFNKNVTIIRLLLGSSMYKRNLCPLCKHHVPGSDLHVLISCEGIVLERERNWKKFEEVCPVPLVDSMKLMNKLDLSHFILNGCYIEYNHEWKTIFDKLSDFIYNVMNAYQAKVCSIQE